MGNPDDTNLLVKFGLKLWILAEPFVQLISEIKKIKKIL